jgi:hypothetical protein
VEGLSRHITVQWCRRGGAAAPIHEIAAGFIRSNPAENFYKDNAREPAAAQAPIE